MWPMAITSTTLISLATLIRGLREMYCLRHPAIAEIYGFVLLRSEGEQMTMMSTPSLVYVVTEKLPHTLADVEREGNGGHVSWQEGAKLSLDIGKAIMALHSLSPPHTHGYINAANVMCDDYGRKVALVGLEKGMAMRLIEV